MLSAVTATMTPGRETAVRPRFIAWLDQVRGEDVKEVPERGGSAAHEELGAPSVG